jgi:hypothetical protein
MRKRETLKIRLFLIRGLIAIMFLGLISYPHILPAVIQDPPSAPTVSEKEKSVPEVESLLARLKTLEEPVSREGAGTLIAQAPGERYKVQFRLLARGPEAFRLEIFDLFGRPSWVMISYKGETHLFSLTQQKEIPTGQTFSGPLSAISQMPISEMTKIFWGRVPLLPYEEFQIKTDQKAGQESVRLLLKGAGRQEFYITRPPFSLLKCLIMPTRKADEIEVTFSDFSAVAGSLLPLKCEVRQREKEQDLAIRYEFLIPRDDIPDDVFQWPLFIPKNAP